MSAAVETAKHASPQKRQRAHLTDRAKAERSLGWKLAGPAFVVMLFVTLWPIADAVWLSLFNYRLTDPAGKTFVWFQNYITALSDPLFWQTFVTTFAIVIFTLIFELIFGMALAMVMHKIVIPRKTLRTIVLIPYSIITVVSAFAWTYAVSVSSGFMNYWLHFITAGGFPLDYDWFGGRWSSLFIICLSEIWKTTPFMSLLLLAGLAQVDSSMEEAAQVDGATWWQRFYKVVLPNMKAALMVAVLFRTLDAIRIYDNPYVMTGGAHETTTLSMLVSNETITRVEIGMGSCLSVILFIIVLIVAAIFVRGFKVDLTSSGGN
ncbi:carbohydrate ABC transporter permease [Leekyejoonella antrihumi]|uniref:Sugar ABC transporter permease n=1 Tax=Leekyejoonella antrihumi TaxID=1660198 RepID=A0A563E4G3_9MICO|nr:sugar ABC transporter permease [Leekyejoonella antrihumi]TWP37418.1 sugar ABC transporter permease [Leekyejoonella antrihumi]